ncbi:unnamed protein product [Effrenium voratum]|uniref:Hexosyltransferase n=1 Tax=Effrenium voratum TaxID=2562239 RepID=A0AA36J5Y0_9DINO|nr:unnamed protein product [Effrenium voratum]
MALSSAGGGGRPARRFQVDYLQGCPQLYENYKVSRFQERRNRRDVFTKLQALSCTDYSQVLMMDLDMLVRGNLDELFELRAPAALKRCSGREQPEHGADFTAEDLWSWQRDKMSSGLNAGVMLLRPDAKVYERMVREIRDPTHPEHLGTFGPEQDYLARFFTTFGRGAWAHLHARFNYQPNLPDDYVGAAHRKLDVIQDVMVAHYSGGRVKPWKLRNLELNAQGVRRLLEDDTLEAEMGGEAPRASRPMVMDGVAVGQRDTGLPANVKAVMWEWILALRRCDQELLEAAVDLLFLIGEAGGR